MAEQVSKTRRVWENVVLGVSWILLSTGFVVVAKTALFLAKTKHVTNDSLSWFCIAFLALLLGSLLNSVAREQRP